MMIFAFVDRSSLRDWKIHDFLSVFSRFSLFIKRGSALFAKLSTEFLDAKKGETALKHTNQSKFS